ncbi:RagB/SusD family nutrient uptake outer membrane protein [Prolixibacteraceae bacterium JC049]|nr:RagB/SusD family nutrient uptake outer membrane protein [Prolixibacteraceae bacterium JC049]
MKKLTTIYLLILMVVGVSCSDYLDVVPDNVATIDNAFTNQHQAYKYLVTCYSYLPKHGQVSENPAFLSGDEAWMPDATLQSNTVDAWKIGRGEQIVTDPILNYWNGSKGGRSLYVGIRDCNIFLDNIDQVRDMDEVEINRWKGEVKFLKAYYHFWLLRMYGPVMKIENSLPVSTPTTELFQERSGIDETFAYIVQLIDEAAPDLPLRIENSTEELGRITQPAALAMKARILMEAASPLFNGNTDFASLTNKDGEPLFNQEYKAEKWQLALDACNAAIDVCLQGGHGLYQTADYKSAYDLNDNLLLDCALRSTISEPYNKEIIWGCAKSWKSDIQYRSFARLASYVNEVCSSNLAPTMKVVETYYSKNGVPINEDNSWDYANRYNLQTVTEEYKDWMEEGEKTVKLHFDREPRFYSSLGFDRGVWYGSGKYEEGELQVVHTRSGEPANQYNWTDYSITGYWAKKLVNLQTIVGSNKTSLSVKGYAFPIIRMADLYLLKAEAANEVNGTPNSDVYDAIDIVRKRAALNGVVESWANYSINPDLPSTKDGMREIIHRERMIELAMEGKRYWDIRRWKKAISYFSEPVVGWSLLEASAENFYQPKVLFLPQFSVRDYFWPIKESELVKNPDLIQNIGW